jgi:diguanylate cyclase (GGDEF)-like protein
MGKNPNPAQVDVSDRVDFQQSLKLLDSTISWLWWSSTATIVLLLSAIAVLFVPNLTVIKATGKVLNGPLLSSALLALILILNVYTLLNQHRLKLVRKHLANQIEFTAKQRRKADKFQTLAILDPLTGLYNRRFGEEKLEKEIARAEEGDIELAVITADLDYFKQINDQYGHGAGDIVLKEFSRNLRKVIRACDLPIRIGGDEFLVILPECSRENAQLILSRLNPFEIDLNRRKITVAYSRGTSQFQVGDTPQSIVQRADKALYAEKADRSRTSSPAEVTVVDSSPA